jgi:hypothetical protein
VRIAFINFSGVMPCRPAGSSTIATKYSGASRVRERRVKDACQNPSSRRAFTRLEIGTVVSLDVIDHCCESAVLCAGGP